MMMAMDYIERVVKSDFFLEKTYFTSHVRTILHKYHGYMRLNLRIFTFFFADFCSFEFIAEYEANYGKMLHFRCGGGGGVC